MTLFYFYNKPISSTNDVIHVHNRHDYCLEIKFRTFSKMYMKITLGIYFQIGRFKSVSSQAINYPGSKHTRNG